MLFSNRNYLRFSNPWLSLIIVYIGNKPKKSNACLTVGYSYTAICFR